MTSIFDLKTNVSELSSVNEGTSKMAYDQHPPTRDITTSNFPNGAIHFRWQTSGQKWWVPSRSYLRVRSRLTKANGTQLDLTDNVAPNMGLCGNLFQSLEFRINDKTVSRVSDFVPQVDALETRLSKSSSWLSSVGKSVNWWEDEFSTRQSEVASDGLAPTPVADVSLGRLALGFDAATNTAAYDAGTGIITFAAGGGAALPADVRTVFPVGSYFEWTASPGVDGATNVQLEVLAGGSATTIQVRSLIAVDIVATTAAFQRVTKTPASRRVDEFETIWSPPLSIFKVGHALPSGKYELVLNPQNASVYKQRAIESLGATKVAGTDFDFEIVDMYMYIATVDGPRADDITYLIDLEQTRCQSDKIDTTSFAQKNFDVSPSTYALTVAYQDLRAGTDTRSSASKFRSYDAATVATTEELKLNRFFLNYAGQNLPAPDADPSFIGGTDYTTQRYVESQIYSGAYFDTGGAEDIQEYHNRGSYYYFSIPRDGTDRSTRVNVHQQFNAADVANMRVLLFDHMKQVARIRVQDGRVVDVQLEDA